MSTYIGNTTYAFGRDFNISVSNMNGEDILESIYLNENTLIIVSKVNTNLEDIGSYILFVTDINGNAVRLTYSIEPGNGIYVHPNDTYILNMYIDQSSLMADDGNEHYVNKQNIIDRNTLEVIITDENTAKRGKIGVVTVNHEKESNIRYSIVKPDGVTTYIPYEDETEEGADENDPQQIAIDENGHPITLGTISVNTQNLETEDDAENRDGIVGHISEMFRTIEAVDGKLNVLTYNLDHASYESFGIAKGDEETINV